MWPQGPRLEYFKKPCDLPRPPRVREVSPARGTTTTAARPLHHEPIVMRRTLSYLLTALVISAAASGCSTKIQTETQAPALGSDAQIIAKKGKTGNYEVAISVTNLAPASRLEPSANAFVVWILSKDQAPVRAGALDYDEGDRAGVLQVTSPDASFTLLITLEEASTAASPGGKRILEQAVAVR